MRSMGKMVSVVAALLVMSTVAGAQATVKCKDGTGSKGGQGACSGHGGIGAASAKTIVKADTKMAKTETRMDAKAGAKMAKADAKMAKADAKMAKAEGKKMATATCTDGTRSYADSRAGACSGHGGVKTWKGKPEKAKG